MSGFSTAAIVLRRIDYGDYDYIITLFTRSNGKIPVIAKSAKKSKKRFPGILEVFSVLDVVFDYGRSRKGMPYLKEAALKHPFFNIRSSILKTAYASYWSEVVNLWLEEGQKHETLYRLFSFVLSMLDLSEMDEASLSILFQTRFLTLAGYQPNLDQCTACKKSVSELTCSHFFPSLAGGGIVCGHCSEGKTGKYLITKGTLKQLQWIDSPNLDKASRMRFSSSALKECTEFLESFVPYHLGREPKSLTFLKQIRRGPL